MCCLTLENLLNKCWCADFKYEICFPLSHLVFEVLCVAIFKWFNNLDNTCHLLFSILRYFNTLKDIFLLSYRFWKFKLCVLSLCSSPDLIGWKFLLTLIENSRNYRQQIFTVTVLFSNKFCLLSYIFLIFYLTDMTDILLKKMKTYLTVLTFLLFDFIKQVCYHQKIIKFKFHTHKKTHTHNLFHSLIHSLTLSY